MAATIKLDLDQDGAEFYIEMFTAYALKHNDVAVADDAKCLRERYEMTWGEYEGQS